MYVHFFLSDCSFFKARASSDYLKGLGIIEPERVLREAEAANRRQEMENRRVASLASGMERKKPVNVFAKRKSDDDDELMGNEDLNQEKEETPALVKRYKNQGALSSLAEVHFWGFLCVSLSKKIEGASRSQAGRD